VAEAAASKDSGLTRGKAITIALLAVVLVVVLYWQYGSSGSALTNTPSAYKPRRPVATASTEQPQQTSTDTRTRNGLNENAQRSAATVVLDEKKWKSPDLKQVVDYDPFALPAAFPRPQTIAENATNAESIYAAAAEDEKKRRAEIIAQQQLEWQELRQRGVHVIVRQHDEFVAVIGDQTVHVGDEINGYTITGIDSQGVHVERKQAP